MAENTEDEELQSAIERFLTGSANSDHEVRLAERLRVAADDHADLQRGSREVGDKRVYR
jgi:hypothetical protein